MCRRNFLLAATILSALLLPNCGGGSPPPPPVMISVSPTSQKVAVGASLLFSATVTNTTNLAVTWQVNGTTGGNAVTTGSISPTGVYTAPANVPNPATVTITAVSQADSTKSASASVTVTVAVSVTPPQARLNLSATQPFAATVSGVSNQAVTWQVNGVLNGNPTLGTISDAGLYTAPTAIPSPSTVTVNAVSQADPTQSGNAAVTIGDVTINQNPETAPIELGTSGGNENDKTTSGNTVTCCSGTLGSLVIRNGVNFILSNNHVLGRSGHATAGEPVDQPGLVDTNCQSATLVANFTQAAPLDGRVDAAIAQIVNGQVDTSGAILQLGAVSGGVPQPEAPANTVNSLPMVSMSIAKSGRTTGLSCGTVQATNTSVQVDYSTTCGGATTSTVTYSNQVLTSGNFAGAGDSGSLIVDATTAQPVALLFAGDPTTRAAVGNPIQQVLDAFKSGTNAATIVGGPQHQVSGCTGMAPQPAPLAATTEQQLFQGAVPAAIAVKERHETELMSDPAVLAVGIGASTTPGQPAIIVDVERGKPHRAVPSVLEGIPTRIISTGRFKASDWIPNASKQCSGKKSPAVILPIK